MYTRYVAVCCSLGMLLYCWYNVRHEISGSNQAPAPNRIIPDFRSGLSRPSVFRSLCLFSFHPCDGNPAVIWAYSVNGFLPEAVCSHEGTLRTKRIGKCNEMGLKPQLPRHMVTTKPWRFCPFFSRVSTRGIRMTKKGKN